MANGGLKDIGGGFKQFVPGAGGGSGVGGTLQMLKQQQLIQQLQLQQEQIKEVQDRRGVFPERVQRERQQALIQANQELRNQLKFKQDALDSTLETLPKAYRQFGAKVADQFVKRMLGPEAGFRETDNKKGQIVSLPGGETFLTNINNFLEPKEVLDTELKLGDTFRKNTQDAHESILAYDAIEQVAANNPRGLSDIALTYLFIRGLDPGGRVTDAEIRLPGTADPLLQRMVRTYLNLAEGGTLSPEQRQEMIKLSGTEKRRLFGVLAPEINKIRSQSEAYGLSADRIISPRGVVFRSTKEGGLQVPDTIKRLYGDKSSFLKSFENIFPAKEKKKTQAPSAPIPDPSPSGIVENATDFSKQVFTNIFAGSE